jgi:hypothetical protein
MFRYRFKATGAQALKEVFASLHQAFPDLHVTVEDLIEEGDKVVGRGRIAEIWGVVDVFSQMNSSASSRPSASGYR